MLVDDLLEDLNRGAIALPNGLFFADDRAILYRDRAIIVPLLEYVRV